MMIGIMWERAVVAADDSYLRTIAAAPREMVWVGEIAGREVAGECLMDGEAALKVQEILADPQGIVRSRIGSLLSPSSVYFERATSLVLTQTK